MKLNVIITGSTGMVGKGALLECLDSEHVEKVLVVNRRTLGMEHPKLSEILVADFSALGTLTESDGRSPFAGYNACFFSVGVSSIGMNEADYTRLTYDLTIEFANTLHSANPDMIFCYVSGAGTDSTEKGRSMWARVKGKTENDLLKMGFKAAYMFRPGFIQPLNGIRSATPMYDIPLRILAPIIPLLKRMFPSGITSTLEIGQAMIKSVLIGFEKQHLENRDINELAARNL